MLAQVYSMELQGLKGYQVSLQVDISFGLPCFEIVGLPDASIKEAKERVKTAIKNIQGEFLSRKIIINLAPANTRKEGSKFDLPMAIGILIASGQIKNKYLNKFLKETVFIGELALDGAVESVKGVLPMCIEMKKLGFKRIILPEKNAEEAQIVNDIEIIPLKHLDELIKYLNGESDIVKCKSKKVNLKSQVDSKLDYSEVKGQEIAKRALEISAAGGHNCLLIRTTRIWKNKVSKKVTQYFTRYEH